MFVVTFYSYKGGVGRTLALVHCAAYLARQGKKVFILDFDLEAPGVDAFHLCGSNKPRRGIVEYIGRYRKHGSIESLDDYVCEVIHPSIPPGKVHFIPAGRKDEEYQVLLSGLDWKYFYKQESGFLFVENLKAAIEDKYAPDYVLIDSRTGLTDVSGICTLQLPDLVVLLFNLNNQNVLGIRQMYRLIRHNKLNKQIKTLLVASPIPDLPGYSEQKDERLRYAQSKIEAEYEVILPFDPRMAFEETILDARNRGPLARSYDKLSREIRRRNEGDVLTKLERAQGLVKEGDVERADAKFRETVAAHPRDPDALLSYAQFLRIRRNKEALTYMEQAYELRPSDSTVIGELIRTHIGLGQTKEAVVRLQEYLKVTEDPNDLERLGMLFESKGVVEPARQLFEKAVEISKSPRTAPHLDLGNTYMALNRPDIAAKQFEKALETEPSSIAATFNYGYALSKLKDPRANEYLARAIEAFEQKPMDSSSEGRANALQAMSHAYLATGKKNKAREALEQALEIAKGKDMVGQRIFSSVKYRYIPSKEFIEETSRLLRKVCSRQG